MLTVTDNEGATGTATKVVNVVEATPPGADCKPQGLYQTPGVNTPYCTVYDANGREKMGADHPRRVIGYFTSWRNGANGPVEPKPKTNMSEATSNPKSRTNSIRQCDHAAISFELDC